MMLIGIDTGGTFTDFVLIDDDGMLVIYKTLSTPQAPERSILDGMKALNCNMEMLQVVHGSTVATNAVLEGKGARTAYITNRGLADVLTIGRQARRELYNLQPARRSPPVPPEWCLETGGRLAADGSVIEPLTAADIEAIQAAIRSLKPEAVAINLLFSFLDGRFEQQLAAALPADLFVSRSSAVLPEYREYERGITTWLNSYVGPLVQGYLSRLGERLQPDALAVMRSSGETCAAAEAGQEAVHLLLSGPAGGLAGARHVARLAGCERVLTFDMGGTSTDVALIDGDIALSSDSRIGEYPVGVPMVDMHTIGAGGGSIARVDAGGMLLVGPESAGADPGPVCYDRGGRQVTVTDANLVLGRLPAGTRLSGGLHLNAAAARTALAELARQIGSPSPEDAALGVVRIANEHMAQALRVISVERGVDPREFTLVSFGGAGGLHVCALAGMLGMRRALAPVHAGVLSALGMLVAPRGRQLSRTLGVTLTAEQAGPITTALQALKARGCAALAREGYAEEDLICLPGVDICYRGQSHTLNLPWTDVAACEAAFHDLHEQRYGHRLAAPVQLVNVRMAVKARERPVELPHWPARQGLPDATVPVYGIEGDVPVWARTSLAAGQSIDGPAIVTDPVATLYLAPDWRCSMDTYGNLLLHHNIE